MYLLKQLSEIGSKLRKKRGGFLIVSSKHKFLEANLALWEMYEICLKGHFWVSPVGLHVRDQEERKWRHREVGSYPCGNDNARQLQNSRAQDGAACRGPGAATLTWGRHLCTDTPRGTRSGRTLGDTNCLHRVTKGWKARTGPA